MCCCCGGSDISRSGESSGSSASSGSSPSQLIQGVDNPILVGGLGAAVAAVYVIYQAVVASGGRRQFGQAGGRLASTQILPGRPYLSS